MPLKIPERPRRRTVLQHAGVKPLVDRLAVLRGALRSAYRGPAPLSPAVSERHPRNAPCPCGSGKKFKRCCESSERRAMDLDTSQTPEAPEAGPAQQRMVRVYDRVREAFHELPASQRCVEIPKDFDTDLRAAEVTQTDAKTAHVTYVRRNGLRGPRTSFSRTPEPVSLPIRELGDIPSGTLCFVDAGLLSMWTLCDIDPPRTVLRAGQAEEVTAEDVALFDLPPSEDLPGARS